MKSSFSEFKARFSLFQPKSIKRGDDVIDLGLTEEDVMQDLTRHGTNNRLLERFSKEQVREALDHQGVWKRLAEKGYPDADLKIQSIDPFRQTVRVLTSLKDPEDEAHTLCE